jgi:hypothetical protein
MAQRAHAIAMEIFRGNNLRDDFWNLEQLIRE